MADRPTSRLPALAALPLVVAVATAVAGCLPTGTRGTGGPDATGAGGRASPSPTIDPRPSGPTPVPSYVAPTPTPAPTFVAYTVGRGDSLNTIARKFGTTARSIAFWNRATYPSLDPESSKYRPNLLQVGWTLMVIPRTTFDEQTLPEPSGLDIVSPEPSASEPDDGEVVTGVDVTPAPSKR
jgi:LysM domain